MVASVCPDPSTKLLELRSRFSPAGQTASPVAWRELHEGLLGGVPRYDHAGQATRTVSVSAPFRSLVWSLLTEIPLCHGCQEIFRFETAHQGQLIARGDLDGSLLREDIRPIRGRMQEVYTAPSWQPFPWDTVTSSAPALPAHGITQSITVLANRE
jgi:hypothetical protein